MRNILQYAGLCALLFLAAPYMVTITMDNEGAKPSGRISRSMEMSYDKLAQADDFDKYIIGVVAAEMPALYNLEALKAQAVASRTYSVNFMERAGVSDYAKITQAYINEIEMSERWGEKYDEYYSKIAEAVLNTSKEIMVYEGEAIVAVFHAFSGGRTENSADVWKEDLPYLKSVPSEFDATANGFEQEKRFSGDEFITLLHEVYPDLVFDKGDIADQIKINEYTEGGYVKSITIGNKIMSGTALRGILFLRSANFQVYRDKEQIVFVVKGYGHGAGMSQVGANYLAGEGYSYREILAHYYSGIEFVELE